MAHPIEAPPLRDVFEATANNSTLKSCGVGQLASGDSCSGSISAGSLQASKPPIANLEILEISSRPVHSTGRGKSVARIACAQSDRAPIPLETCGILQKR